MQIKQIRSLPIQTKNYTANNEHFADLTDSTSETTHTSTKKLRIYHILKKNKVKNSNENYMNDRINNMNQNKTHTGTNDKN